MPSVSVLMPVYNGEKYLAAAVESILAQAYRDFEFVILNDGSTDGSMRILERFQRRDPRIRVLSRENRGLVQTVNELIGFARGEWVALMAQDDISLPERLALQSDFLRRHPEVLCVGGCVSPRGGPARAHGGGAGSSAFSRRPARHGPDAIERPGLPSCCSMDGGHLTAGSGRPRSSTAGVPSGRCRCARMAGGCLLVRYSNHRAMRMLV